MAYMKMIEAEFAINIYCWVFGAGTDNGDAYVRGILDEIGKLSEQEQKALECYFRLGMTQKQAGFHMGLSSSRMGEIMKKALRRLKHSSSIRNLSVSRILESKERQLAEARAKITELYDQFEQVKQGAPIETAILTQLEEREASIAQLGLSARVYNCLTWKGIRTIKSLLARDHLDRIRNFGKKSKEELILKMREAGYTEWADRMEAMEPAA